MTNEEADIAAYEKAREDAYLEACESDSPNSPDFDNVVSHITRKLCKERGIEDLEY